LILPPLISAATANLDRLSMFVDTEYEINSDLTFFARTLHSRVESFGRYAPAAGAFTWTGPNLDAEEITHNGQTVTLSPLNTGDIIYYRFDNTGPGRDSWQEDFQSDIQIGLEGLHNNIEWHLGYQYDLYKMHEWGDGYVNVLGLNQAASQGWDPRHPNQEQFENAVPGMRENANRRASMEYQRVDFGAQFDGPMMSGGPVMFYSGGEFRQEQYRNQTQAQAEAGNIIGTSGGSGGGNRDVWAVFGETSLPLADTFELGAAVRYDNYSDFGSEVTGKLSFPAARWAPVETRVRNELGLSSGAASVFFSVGRMAAQRAF
jgi:iron complex outermembrane receptor protein